MKHFDPSTLWRSTVGFDRVLDLLNAASAMPQEGYPPYDIERGQDDTYRIHLAVAGFNQNDITVTAEPNCLTVEGHGVNTTQRTFLHQGIATRPFKRVFNLADFVEVIGATLENGILTVSLKREMPEAMKPRRIEISAKGAASGKSR